jgi:hypothetical protein
MVFLKRRCPSERRKAIIAVNATLSSDTLAVDESKNNDDDPQFELHISLSIAESTRPGESITICTNKSVFAPAQPEDELDTLAQKTASLTSTSDSTSSELVGLARRHQQISKSDPRLTS